MTSLQCVEAFSPAQPGEEQNHEEYGLQSGQYLHSWDGVVIKAIDISSSKFVHICVDIKHVNINACE